MRSFYLAYSGTFQTVSGILPLAEKQNNSKASEGLVVNASLLAERFSLPWSHYVRLLKIACVTMIEVSKSTPKEWPYVSPGWSESKRSDDLRNPGLPRSNTAENPEGVALSFYHRPKLEPPLWGFIMDAICYPGLRECSPRLTFAPPRADIGTPLRG